MNQTANNNNKYNPAFQSSLRTALVSFEDWKATKKTF